MATYDLNQTELNQLMIPNIDPAVRAAVLDYLFDEDLFTASVAGRHGHKGHNSLTEEEIQVQISDGTDPLDPDAEALNLTASVRHGDHRRRSSGHHP